MLLVDDGNKSSDSKASALGLGLDDKTFLEENNEPEQQPEDLWPEEFDEYGNEVQNGIQVADKEIYSDPKFNASSRQEKIQKAKRLLNIQNQTANKSPGTITNKKEINSKNHKAENSSLKNDSKKQSTLKKYGNKIQDAKKTIAKFKSAIGKNKTNSKNKNSSKESGEDKSTSEKLKPDLGKLAHDATHGDPRKIVGELGDQYLHAGRRIGDSLFFLWTLLTLGSIPLVLGLLITFPMLNLLLISPNWCFRITRWILDIILDFFGVGEALTVIQQFGITKVDVKISGWQKATIIAIDAVVLVFLLLVFVFIVTIFCYSVGGGAGWVIAKILDFWNQTGGLFAEIRQACGTIGAVVPDTSGQ